MKIQTQIICWHSQYIAEVRVTDGKHIVHYEVKTDDALISYPERKIVDAVHKLAKMKFKQGNQADRMVLTDSRICYL